MAKRILIFLLTNLAVIGIISIILSLFNISPYLSAHGLNYQSLLIYATVVGFTGSFISLFISKWMAIHSFGVRIIESPSNQTEEWLNSKVLELSRKVGIKKPDVGIYESAEPNAFATGWNKNNALLAVSTGLLKSMDQEGVEGVLGHEVSHIANGDMVTLTLIQGVINTFVIFFARIAAFFVTSLLNRGNEQHSKNGFVYYFVAFIFEIIFGVLATIIVMWFSRHREYRADAGSARIVGKDKMISALQQLSSVSTNKIEDNRAPGFNVMKISHEGGWSSLFASHPPLQQRIKALGNSRAE